ncbi:MAG: SMP-30/gluconolactonase/LRE family protein, partial [Ferruginibacter sp.]
MFPEIFDNGRKLLRFLIYLLLLSTNTFSQQTYKAIASDTIPTLVSRQFKFTEGPAVDRSGNVYFTDQPNNKIWKYDIKGNWSVFLDSAGRSNGMYFDRKGNLITCADEKNQLWSISPKGKVTILLDDFKGHRFNGPNDLWIDTKEGIYFTDPYFQRDYWVRKSPDPGINGEKLYFLAKGKKEAVIVDENLKKPNGIVGSADGKHLFV